ncbi:uncharacterized protein BDV17DRAFT_272906 [Aspergillus undulatus]|uniref:uncharacterized protein n=1 Tax=Aspergillus undulatus TaxID=1810928 RepID=UPI003CCD7F41
MSASELKELLFFKDADTLALIDPPSYKPAWSLQPSSAQSIGHRIHSVKLLATGSPVLKQLFEPTTQERNIKRRGGLPEGIKYIIDLTPPSEGEDAVLLLTELSCPLGIRTWAESQSRWELPKACVAGVDTPSQPNSNDSSSLSDYSPSRHRAGIVHILQLLEGDSPQLDTPCKLWTFFAVARLYEIATMPQISVRVAFWVYEMNNKRLIELHPEITYRLAKGIQCGYLMQDSFCVLVGEEALSIIRNSGAPTPRKQHETVHGRPQEGLDDDDIQRVQYSGESFLGYIIEKFVELAGSEMRWLNESPQWQNIVSYPRAPNEDVIVDGLVSCLKDFVRNAIFASLDQQSSTRLLTKIKFDGSGNYPADAYMNAYNSMNLLERIMTRTFWRGLCERKLTEHDGHAYALHSDTTFASLVGYIGAFRDQQNTPVRSVTPSELNSRVIAFNNLVDPWPEKNRGKYFTSEYNYQMFINGNGHDRRFSVQRFLEEVEYFMAKFARGMFEPPRAEMSYDITDTLTCLREEEYKYLPLWAGGCDDGTGGVYDDQVPLAETDGFSAPGPSIHTGSAAPSEVTSPFSLRESTVYGASHRATEGFASEVVSINSEGLSEAGNVSLVDSADFRKVDNELSMALDSSADGIDDVFFDSDSASDDTVVIEHADDSEISEFEELNLNDARAQSLPIREKSTVA